MNLWERDGNKKGKKTEKEEKHEMEGRAASKHGIWRERERERERIKSN